MPARLCLYGQELAILALHTLNRSCTPRCHLQPVAALLSQCYMLTVVYLNERMNMVTAARQVYGRQAPLPELPEALFLTVFAAVDAYGLNRRLASLERVDTRAPDALPLAAGVATLLRQFHPAYAEVLRGCSRAALSSPASTLAAGWIWGWPDARACPSGGGASRAGGMRRYNSRIFVVIHEGMQAGSSSSMLLLVLALRPGRMQGSSERPSCPAAEQAMHWATPVRAGKSFIDVHVVAACAQVFLQCMAQCVRTYVHAATGAVAQGVQAAGIDVALPRKIGLLLAFAEQVRASLRWAPCMWTCKVGQL